MQKHLSPKKLKKTIATILVFVMVFQFVPNIVIAVNMNAVINKAETKADATKSLEEHLEKETKERQKIEPIIIGELKEERTYTEKHFLRSDGSIVASIFPSNVHYEKNGKFLDVDNTLEEVTDTKETLKMSEKDMNQEYLELKASEQKIDMTLIKEKGKETKLYKNKVGNAKISFTNKTNGYNLGSIESEGHIIKWGLENSRASNVNVSNENLEVKEIQGLTAEEMKIKVPRTSIEYTGILEDISIEYSVEPEHVKENIILQNKEAIRNELKFTYDVGTLKMKLLETKDIIVYDKTEDDIKFTIEAPFMYDNKLEFSSDIDVKLENEDGKYIVTLIPNKKWLNTEERIYPVTIDPSIITSRYYQDIKDTFIYSTQGSEAKGNAHIIRAGNNSGVPTRSLVKFNLPELKSGDQVIGAYLNIFSYPKTSEWTPPTRKIQLNAHKMTADWEENTAIWNNINTNYNSKAEDFILYQFDNNNQCKQYTFNITSVAKEWYTTGKNYGVMIKENIETNNVSGNEAYFISSDTNVAWYEGRPVVQIIYRNQTGVEDYLSYHVQDLGRAGTVYTNDYNGNLTWVHNDISTPGERFPVTITHIYNTNDKDIKSRYGNGMKLNLSQTIELVNIGGAEYAEYIDEDGTRHYFTKEGNVYKDEEGLNLELTLDASTAVFTMKDKGDNILRFERRSVAGRYLWHLKDIEDNNGNKITITFLASQPNDFIITKVTDGAGQSITFQYDGYYLKKMIAPDGKEVKYTYLTTGVLYEIFYPDGEETMFDYRDNLITMIIGLGGRCTTYEYYPEKTNRIKKISEYSDSLKIGNSLEISYSNNLTTFTDNKGFSNNVTFNDWGQAISVADFGKGNLNFSEAYGKVYNYGTEGGNKNKLTLDGSLTKSVNNLLMNGSAEYDGCWQGVNWGLNNGTYSYSREETYSGARSLKLTNPESGSYYTFYCQELEAPKGKTYTLSSKVKSLDLASNEGGQLFVYYYDANGVLVRPQSEFIRDTNGWSEYNFTFTYPENATSKLFVCIGLMGCKGTIYYDDIQLEEGTVANQCNMIENSVFDYSGNNEKSWIKYNTNSMWDSVATSGNTNLFRLYGDTSQRKGIYQNVVTSGKAGDVFSVSGWVYAGGTRAKGNTCNTIAINVIAHDNTEQWLSIGINTSDQWQFVQQEFVAKHDYKLIQIYFCFYENVNEAYITNVALYKDYFGASYQYDGNDNLIKYTNPKGGTFEYQYDTAYKHRLIKAISGTGVNYNFGYNQYGQATTSKITNNSNNQYIETNAEYTTDGNYLTKIKDETGNETTYEYNQTNGNLNKVTDAKGTETNYTYDTLGRISTVSKTSGNQIHKNSYTYVEDRINTITHNGFNYSFTYDNFGNRTNVEVGNQTLITNNYAANNGNLDSVIYGNGQTISYSYDRFNRITTQTKKQGTYKYMYGAQSNLAFIEAPEGIKEYYTYDLSGRLVNANNTTYGFKKSYKYDENNNINSAEYVFNNNTNKVNYEYDNQNRIKVVSVHSGNLNSDNRISIELEYDELSRLQYKFLLGITRGYVMVYEYKNVGNARTTSKVSKIETSLFTLLYNYDEIGNIKNIAGRQKATYYYDSLNQLIREDNRDLNKTITYEYDLGGNITSKTEYPYTTKELGTVTNTINYTYGNTNWKDQLTEYDGKTITYDEIGNPLTYDGNTYTWQNGRELYSITNKEKGQEINYRYTDEGIRKEKIVNGEVTRYHLEGTKVIYEKKDNDNNEIYYFYDNDGDISGLEYNKHIYAYSKNLQGDIIGIFDNEMNEIVSYTYDSWGKVISIKDEDEKEITDPNHIGKINPYRYRSYRYDEETGLYYLNSRYYNPEWGRFLNADGLLKSSNSLLSHNLYVYCDNSPINLIDSNGKNWLDNLRKNASQIFKIAQQGFNFASRTLNNNSSTIKSVAGNLVKNIFLSSTNNGHGNVPVTGKPNSTVQKPNGDLRVYGPDGKVLKDIDSSHPEKHPELKNPHEHDWTWDGNKPNRGDAHNFANIGKGIGIGIGSYALYRGIRMIPSLFPALWWTIPVNAATP